MLKFHSELILIVDEIVDLGEDASPFPLRVRKHSEYWLQALSVELCLIIQVLEREG